MKLRHSLRVYVAAYVLVAGMGLLIAFAYIAAQYFYIGVDASYTGSLNIVANTTDIPEQGLTNVQGINITSHWEDQPLNIRQQFSDIPQNNYQLKKVMPLDWPWQRPNNIYYAIMIIRGDGKPVYLSSHITRQMIDAVSPNMGYIEWLYVYLAAGILALAAILIYLISRTTRQVEKLKTWAEHIHANGADIKAPKLKYSELNDLANIIRSSVLEVRESVAREKVFLSYASHELRTPISTIVANVELINRYNNSLQDEVINPIQRIERAAQTMRHLTETLLGLSRKNEQLLDYVDIDLQELIQQICESLRYMLHSNAVELHIRTEPYIVTVQGAAVHIALANIIRNAFQHTYEGHITIQQQGSKINIDNQNLENGGEHNAELGFGLGLRLTQEIADTFHWHYQNTTKTNGHHVELYLPN